MCGYSVDQAWNILMQKLRENVRESNPKARNKSDQGIIILIMQMFPVFAMPDLPQSYWCRLRCLQLFWGVCLYLLPILESILHVLNHKSCRMHSYLHWKKNLWITYLWINIYMYIYIYICKLLLNLCHVYESYIILTYHT